MAFNYDDAGNGGHIVEATVTAGTFYFEVTLYNSNDYNLDYSVFAEFPTHTPDLSALITGKTKYFVNTRGDKGVRSYAEDRTRYSTDF